MSCHQNIVNFSFDRELIGSRYLGTREHRYISTHSNNRSTPFSSSRDILNSGHFTSRLPRVLVEHEFDLVNSRVNKIFCGQWLDERRCLLGTKCNKLVLLDTFTGMYAVQSPLKSHPSTNNIQDHCGIHAISMNPSGTLLATGADHVNDIAIYSLPDLDPVMVGFKAHSYWIFDILWLDDEHVVSGAGDNRLALWSIGSSTSANNGRIYMKNNDNYVTRNKSPMSDFYPYKLATTRQGRKRRASTLPSWLPQSKISRYKEKLKRNEIRRALWNEVRHLSSSSSSGGGGSNNSPPINNISNNTNNNSSSGSSNSSSSNNFTFDTSSMMNRSHQSRSLGLGSFLSHFNTSYNPPPSAPQNNDDDDDDNDDDGDDSDGYDVTDDEDDDDDDDDDDGEDDEEEEDDDDDEDSDDSDDDYDEIVYQNDFGYSYADDSSSIWPSSLSRSVEITEEDDDDDEDNNEDEEMTNYNEQITSTPSSKRTRTVGTMTDGANPYRFRTPTKTITCKHSNRIRALAFNPKRNEIAAISMNSAFHYFDVKRFEQKYTKKLSPLKENVCLTINQDFSIYAVGSASHVQLIDANNAHPITEPILVKQDIGIRSLHFRNYVLSVGTGVGTILFYDVRAKKFLPADHDAPLIAPNESTLNKNYLKLDTKRGWIWKNENYYEHLPYSTSEDNTHAIYSHSYDPSGTKLLSVGGPLTINLYGHYAAVWE